VHRDRRQVKNYGSVQCTETGIKKLILRLIYGYAYHIVPLFLVLQPKFLTFFFISHSYNLPMALLREEGGEVDSVAESGRVQEATKRIFLYSNTYPTRCNVTQFIYILKLLYMFWVLLPPIIRSAYNCIYSIWYLSHRYCYLLLSWMSCNSRSSSSSTTAVTQGVPTHPRQL